MKRLFTIAAVLALGFALAGCDACGNWPWQSYQGGTLCRGGPPAK